MLALAVAALGSAGSALDCASLVPNPVDSSPKRSPQAIHTALLPKFAGKEIVEIGTRNGDGMACFARVAMHATAVEIDEEACHKLHNLSIALGREIGGTPEEAFSVICGGYAQLGRRRPPWWQFPSLWWRGPLDADIVTWWQNPSKHPKHSFENTDVLRRLSAMQRNGTIRSSAVAVFLFDAKHKPDAIDLRRYRPAAEWHIAVPFDEFATCCERGHRAEEYGVADCAAYARMVRGMVSAGSNRSWACERARGKYHAIGLPLRDVTDALLDGNLTEHAHQLKRIRRRRRTYEVVRLIGGVALLTCILAVAITRLQKLELEAARVADGARDERAMLREASRP